MKRLPASFFNQVTGQLVAIAGVMLVIWSAITGSLAEAAQFSCRDRVLVDYAAPLAKMPGDRLARGALDFGPRDVELRPGRSVIVEREPIAYTLKLDRAISEQGHVLRPAHVGWGITLKLERVDRRGRPTGPPRERRWRVESLRYPERHLGAQAGQGVYRISVTIRDLGGPTLASYRQFVRVLPLRRMLSVRINGDSQFSPGETVVARIENRGTTEALLPLGVGLTAEHFEGGLWKKIETEPSPEATFPVGEFIPPGRAARCSFFTIPADSTPGLLRLSALAPGGRKIIFKQFGVR